VGEVIRCILYKEKNYRVQLRDYFVKFAFSLLTSGSVREKMERTELIELLSNSFSGLAHLIRFARKLKVLEPPQ